MHRDSKRNHGSDEGSPRTTRTRARSRGSPRRTSRQSEARTPRRRTDSSTIQRVFRRPAALSLEELARLRVLREELEVTVEESDDVFPPISNFEELDVLPKYILESLRANGRTAPMPIQAQALPIILGGQDLIGIARTGSGKTLAFLIPAIVHIEAQACNPLHPNSASPICLILAPTRELVAQIAEEASKLLENSTQGNHRHGISADCVYGGKSRQEQLRRCRGCAIVVATPGRLTDFVGSRDISLRRVTFLVLDEADRMLDYGFQEEVKSFASHVRPDRQMLFFSATWPKEVQDLASSLCQDLQQPVKLCVGQRKNGAAATRPDIQQEVVVYDQDDWGVRERAKQATLYTHCRMTLQDRTSKVLVFVSNKNLADELAYKLYGEGFATESMHGGRNQFERDAALESFKKNEVRLLVATDVMGRGLDIPDISHVVIYDMGDVDDYIHRIGRTARGLTGRPGHALTLFEYNQKWPELAGGLAKVLEESGQPVPEELARIAQEVQQGGRKVVERVPAAKKVKKGWQDWNAGATGQNPPRWSSRGWESLR